MSATLAIGQVNVDPGLFEQLPTHAKIVFAALLAAAIGALAVKYSAEAFSAIRGKMKRRGHTNPAQLKDHSFFTRCESWSKYKVTEMYFGDEMRNKLFRTIISGKIDVTREKMAEAIGRSDLHKMNKKAFQSFVFNLIIAIRTTTQAKIRDKIIEMYPRNGLKIYELVMNHEDKGFNAFNQITDNYTERLVDIICESDIYEDNYEKMEMILDAFKAALGAAFPHIEASFKGFNGELDEITKK